MKQLFVNIPFMIFFNRKKKIAQKELDSLQDKLDMLRETIKVKRERAREAFEQIIVAIEKTQGIEGLEHLADKLSELGQIFTNGKQTLEEQPEKEIIAFEKTEEELALEDIFEAMASLINSKERKRIIQAGLLKEELKRMMITSLAKEPNHPGDWTRVVSTSDLIQLLEQSKFNVLTQHFESPKALLDESLRLAQESVNMRDLNAFVSHDGADAKGINANQPSSKQQQL